MQNARLDQSQAGIKIAGRNINNLRYANNTISNGRKWRGTKEPLMKLKDESEKAGLNLNFQKRSWHPVLSLHAK